MKKNSLKPIKGKAKTKMMYKYGGTIQKAGFGQFLQGALDVGKNYALGSADLIASTVNPDIIKDTAYTGAGGHLMGQITNVGGSIINTAAPMVAGALGGPAASMGVQAAQNISKPLVTPPQPLPMPDMAGQGVRNFGDDMAGKGIRNYGEPVAKKGMRIYGDGGSVPPKLVNIEGGEIIVDEHGNITHKFPKNLFPPHPKDTSKIDSRGTVDVSGLEGSTIIDKRQAPLYQAAEASKDKLRQRTIIQNVMNKQRQREAQEMGDQFEIAGKGIRNIETAGSGIYIKPSHRGRFTAWAKSHGYSMSEAIAHGKASSDPHVRKMATFAANARSWKHADGGVIKADGGLDLRRPADVADEYRTQDQLNTNPNFGERWGSLTGMGNIAPYPYPIHNSMNDLYNVGHNTAMSSPNIQANARSSWYDLPRIPGEEVTPVNPINPRSVGVPSTGSQNVVSSSLPDPMKGKYVDSMTPIDPMKRLGVTELKPYGGPEPNYNYMVREPKERPPVMDRVWAKGLTNNIGNLYQLGNAIFNKEKTPYVSNEYQKQALDVLKNRKYDINPLLSANQSTYGAGQYALQQGGLSGAEYRANLTNQLRNKYMADSAVYATKNNTEAGWQGEYANMLNSAGEANRQSRIGTNTANEQNKAARQSAIAQSLGAIGTNVMKQKNDDYLSQFIPYFGLGDMKKR